MKKPYLREGVDVYLEEDKDEIFNIIFVFLSTRKRIQIKAQANLAASLPLMNGENTINVILDKTKARQSDLDKLISYLESIGVLIPRNWLDNISFDEQYKLVIEKQLFFLLDILNSPEAVFAIQSKILSTRVAIFGLGAIGSWMLTELLQMGFQNFKLFDFKRIGNDSVSRHAYYEHAAVGEKKIHHYMNKGREINPMANIKCYDTALRDDAEVLEELHGIDLIINCADEPYIGYTSIFLSRFSIKFNKLLLVAGGFDAHLGCLGELIVPNKTPCSDCYNLFFTESLKDWKPVLHPVKDRRRGFGGLPALSVFSASSGALAILRYLINEQEFLKTAGGRGEFKFDDYKIDSFNVERNLNCEVCGDKK